MYHPGGWLRRVALDVSAGHFETKDAHSNERLHKRSCERHAGINLRIISVGPCARTCQCARTRMTQHAQAHGADPNAPEFSPDSRAQASAHARTRAHTHPQQRTRRRAISARSLILALLLPPAPSLRGRGSTTGGKGAGGRVPALAAAAGNMRAHRPRGNKRAPPALDQARAPRASLCVTMCAAACTPPARARARAGDD